MKKSTILKLKTWFGIYTAGSWVLGTKQPQRQNNYEKELRAQLKWIYKNSQRISI